LKRWQTQDKQARLGADHYTDLVGDGEAAAPLKILLGDKNRDKLFKLGSLGSIEICIMGHPVPHYFPPLVGKRLLQNFASFVFPKPLEHRN
jgi:hypothetical protein